MAGSEGACSLSVSDGGLGRKIAKYIKLLGRDVGLAEVSTFSFAMKAWRQCRKIMQP
jgi:hypothetical protein